MTSHPLLDPELQPMFASCQAVPLSAETLPRVRHWADEQAGVLPEPVESGQVRRWEHYVRGYPGAPPVRVLIFRPRHPSDGRPALLHVHGGGFVMGTPEGADARNASLAADLDCVVVSVDYRLAPETRFPGAIQDCYAALRWLHAEAPGLGVDRSRIALVGESAGGGLTAALALLARDRGEIRPAFQLLIYPMLDDRTGSTVMPPPFAGEFIWTAACNRFGWTSLLGQEPGSPGVSAYAAPARADSLAGLPPCFIAVGTLDLFADENMDYARRLIAHGVPTELHVYPGAVHGFDMVPHAHVTRRFLRDSETALRRALGLSLL